MKLILSNTGVPDAPSGFRAMSREAPMHQPLERLDRRVQKPEERLGSKT